MNKIYHYIDIVIYLIHKTYWNIVAHFGKVHGLVLMYHHITNEHKDIMASCQHKPAVFEATLMRLQDYGYTFVSIDEMMKIVEGGSGNKFAVITFDDIMDDVFTNAYPILKRLQLPFAIFVAPGLVGTEDFITQDHLRALADDPLCTIGSHSMSHCHLAKVENSKEELIESKIILEKMFNRRVDYLAYPYGWHCDVSKKVMKEAEEIGYKCAFGTIQSPISETSSKEIFYLPRVVLK